MRTIPPELVARFLAEVDRGEVARTPSVEALAQIFRPAKRGRKPRIEGDLSAFEVDVWNFMAGRMARDRKRGARERALGAAEEHFRKDRRTVERAWTRSEKLIPLDLSESPSDPKWGPFIFVVDDGSDAPLLRLMAENDGV